MSAPTLTRPEPRMLRATPVTVLIAGITLVVLVLAALGADLIRPLDDGVALDNVLAAPSLAHLFAKDHRYSLAGPAPRARTPGGYGGQKFRRQEGRP